MESARLTLEKRPFLKRSLSRAAYHGLIAWASLSLSYCAYKAYVRWLTSSFPAWLKWEIKSSFPPAIVIFASIYLIYHVKARKARPGAWEYAVMLLAYGLCANLMAFNYSTPVVLVLNGALVITALLIALLRLSERLPPHLMRAAERLGIAPWITRITAESRKAALSFNESASGTPSRLIAAGTGLVIICTLLIAAKQRTAAGHAASMAWLLLLSGVSMKLVRSLRDRGED